MGSEPVYEVCALRLWEEIATGEWDADMAKAMAKERRDRKKRLPPARAAGSSDDPRNKRAEDDEEKSKVDIPKGETQLGTQKKDEKWVKVEVMLLRRRVSDAVWAKS